MYISIFFNSVRQPKLNTNFILMDIVKITGNIYFIYQTNRLNMNSMNRYALNICKLN